MRGSPLPPSLHPSIPLPRYYISPTPHKFCPYLNPDQHSGGRGPVVHHLQIPHEAHQLPGTVDALFDPCAEHRVQAPGSDWQVLESPRGRRAQSSRPPPAAGLGGTWAPLPGAPWRDWGPAWSRGHQLGGERLTDAHEMVQGGVEVSPNALDQLRGVQSLLWTHCQWVSSGRDGIFWPREEGTDSCPRPRAAHAQQASSRPRPASGPTYTPVSHRCLRPRVVEPRGVGGAIKTILCLSSLFLNLFLPVKVQFMAV